MDVVMKSVRSHSVPGWNLTVMDPCVLGTSGSSDDCSTESGFESGNGCGRQTMHSQWYVARYLDLMPRSPNHTKRSVLFTYDDTGRPLNSCLTSPCNHTTFPFNQPLRSRRGTFSRQKSDPMTSQRTSPKGGGSRSPSSGGGSPTLVAPSQNGEVTGSQAVLSPSADPEEVALLQKLEEANRMLEADRKSLQTLSPSTQHKQKGRHSNGGMVPSHSRTASISSVISNASISSNISGFNNVEEDTASPDDLWSLWGKITSDWDNIARKKASYIKELVRKGVPHHFRGIVWQLLCNSHVSPAKEKYAEYLKMSSPCEKTIRRDITRTYPEHDFFKEKNGLGQESLFNVMKAYSLQDREVGYCQGSAFIVGLVLMQMPEEEAFAVLVQLMQEYKMRELFKPSMAELGLCMFQLECMIQEHLPALYNHFQAQGFSVSMFASSWFLTLFATSLPIGVTCRVFDVFLSEGLEMIFRVGFAILQITCNNLLQRDMEGMITFLQREMPLIVDQDPDLLFNTAYQVKYNAKKMKKLEKEYNALKSKEQEEQVELRRLRTENRLLRQRIENLEKETATLADRLIQDQVKHAQQEEEVYALRRQLSVAKQQSSQANQRLLEVTDQLTRSQPAPDSTSGSPEGSPTHVTPQQEASTMEKAKDEQIELLQQELVDVRQKEVDSNATVRQLKHKIQELENANRQLQTEPSSEQQRLQEELIACKLREAEANLSLKELQHKVAEVERHFRKFTEAPPGGKPGKHKVEQLQEDLMALRLRESTAVAELKEVKQRLMEMETENHIHERQIKRMQTETEKLTERLDEAQDQERSLQKTIKDLERKLADQQEKRKEDVMMLKIKDAEHSQTIAEMRHRIAELEIENQELITAGELMGKGDKEDLENKIADLQEEILQLKMARRLHSLSSLAINNISLDTESDYDTDDIEATLNSSKLDLSQSMLGDLEGNLVPPRRPQINDLDLNQSYDEEEDEVSVPQKKKVSRRKKRSSVKEIDLDKTPTADSVTSDFSLARLNSTGSSGDQSSPSPLSSSSSSSSSSSKNNVTNDVHVNGVTRLDSLTEQDSSRCDQSEVTSPPQAVATE